MDALEPMLAARLRESGYYSLQGMTGINAWDGKSGWKIEPWNGKKVEAELRKRGLTPVADNQGKDFQSFHVKDPDGWDLQISNVTKANS